MSSPLLRGAFREQLASGRPTFGMFLGLATPMAAEIVALSGADWVLLDLEHGGGDESQVGPTAVASGGYGVPTLVRVESDARIRIGRALDAGASGVMVPRVDSAEQVREVVRHMEYPATGDRGVATYNRSLAWGADAVVLAQPRSAACIIQIETLAALSAVQEIAAVPGVDVLFVGPLDLSFALGVPRDFSNPVFIDAIMTVVAAAGERGITAGILAADAAAAVRYAEMGFGFIAVGSDSTLLASAVRITLTTIREQVK